MSNLSAFLHPVSSVLEEEVIVSNRFVDENGSPAPFKIRSITQEENEKLIAASQIYNKKTHAKTVDSNLYSRRLVIAGTTEPDFTSSEMCSAYGTMDPLEVPGKMLLSGEFAALMKAIYELSGFNNSEEIEEDAKN